MNIRSVAFQAAGARGCVVLDQPQHTQTPAVALPASTILSRRCGWAGRHSRAPLAAGRQRYGKILQTRTLFPRAV